MLKLGEKGAILQRDKKTYAIAPDIPCGMVTTDLLRRIADVSERYHAQAIKITGASRIVIIGLKEEHIDQVWDDLRDCRKPVLVNLIISRYLLLLYFQVSKSMI